MSPKIRSLEIPRLPKGVNLPRSPVLPSVRARIPHPRIPASFGIGPRGVHAALRAESWEWPGIPGDFVGTLPEWLVYWALTKLGLIPGMDFTFQSSQMGPRYEAGAAIVDFLILSRQPNLVIRVQGEYWHYGFGSERQAVDEMQRQELGNHGLEVVDLDESDIRKDPIYFTKQALEGIDVSLAKLRVV